MENWTLNWKRKIEYWYNLPWYGKLNILIRKNGHLTLKIKLWNKKIEHWCRELEMMTRKTWHNPRQVDNCEINSSWCWQNPRRVDNCEIKPSWWWMTMWPLLSLLNEVLFQVVGMPRSFQILSFQVFQFKCTRFDDLGDLQWAILIGS